MGLSLYSPKFNEISFPSEPWNFQVEFSNYYQNENHDSSKATSANIAGSTLANSTLIDSPLTSNSTATSMPAAFLMQLPCSPSFSLVVVIIYKICLFKGRSFAG
jgi:hypothetical protein